MDKTPTDESAQVGNAFASAQDLVHEMIEKGYDPQAIAEGLLEGTRSVLANNEEFEVVLGRWKKLHGL
ncbi:MAG: hypothetical protein ACT6RT_23535 [Allorhizobium sp.]|jgi:hypothetical protein|uniref:hypothetical protein n=1 Tax=Allorhizobium sp. TaxID=633478 RepID=UPI000CBCEF18|nr:MAG: hypothetical protein CVT74_02145 [Alphaproteobacteria bacterium HGW-Alphaproteobacteria-13]